MNIFVLDINPMVAAGMQCDKHVVKMVLESAQMLCNPFPEGTAPYRRTHYNHPCSKWIRESKQNYEWLLMHGLFLSAEYNKRYKKIHKCHEVLKWCVSNYESLNLPDIDLTPFVQAVPDIYKDKDAVTAYRNYYKGDKARFAKWNKGTPSPRWWDLED